MTHEDFTSVLPAIEAAARSAYEVDQARNPAGDHMTAMQISQTISLKRIADTLDRLAQR